jgi:probable F420-dependent oxidoreductase
MRLGISIGANSIDADPATIAGIARAADAEGYTRVVLADHVLGADPSEREGWTGYTHENLWHEPLVTFGYLAAITTNLELMSGVIILPQRATALVAKQAAEVDVLSGGRMVLGVGNGWNEVEFEALGRDFRTRGRQLDEQIALMRALWSQPAISFEGRFHRVTQAGIKPRPAAGDIPIWMGGHSDAALDRVGRLGDGWYPLLDDPGLLAAGVDRIRSAAEAAGRDSSKIGVQGRVRAAGPLPDIVAQVEAWADAGATHVVLGTNPEAVDPDLHVAAIHGFANAWRERHGDEAFAAPSVG